VTICRGSGERQRLRDERSRRAVAAAVALARKAGLIQKAGVLSLTVQREEFPYRYVTVEGTVVGTDRPPSAEQVLAIVRRYMPEEAAQGFVEAELEHPTPEFVLFTVRPNRWLTLDFGDEAG